MPAQPRSASGLYARFILPVAAVILTIAVLGCTAQSGAPATATVPVMAMTTASMQALAPAATLPVLAAAATATPTAIPPPPTATPAPSATPTVTPSPTPQPITLTVGIPADWLAAIAAVDSDLPAVALKAELDPALATDLRLVSGLTALPAGEMLVQEPLALAVTWVDPRQTISGEQAAGLLTGSEPTVTVVAWRDLQPTQRALRIDGHAPNAADYPLQLTWVLTAGTTAQPFATEIAARLRTVAPVDRVLHLAAVGDIMLDRALGRQIAAGALEYPFAYVADALRRADLTVGNFESALGDTGEPAAKSYVFRAPPTAAQSLADAGIDVVSLANNHALDYGAEALLDGIGLLSAAGVVPIGAGRNADAARAPYVVTRNGVTLALLAYAHVPVEWSGFDTQTWTATADAPGFAWADPAIVRADVAAATALADVVVVILHSGYEYVVDPSPPQVAAARAAIDGGAALVIGHHAHILQGVEFYGNGVIVYGLGNFAFEIDGAPETAILDVWLTPDGVREIGFQPAVILPGGQPAPADPATATAIHSQIKRLTMRLNE